MVEIITQEHRVGDPDGHRRRDADARWQDKVIHSSTAPRSRPTLNGHRYPTVEHYYQAQKAAVPADHDRVRDADAAAAEAKQLGSEIAGVPDWDERKVEVMRRGLAAKLTPDSEPGVLLLATGCSPLVEGNDWDDTFWGVCNGRGRNTLGILLTERRGVLRHESAQP